MINAIKFIIKVTSRVILKFRDAWLEKLLKLNLELNKACPNGLKLIELNEIQDYSECFSIFFKSFLIIFIQSDVFFLLSFKY
jgi:hypothetical protein